MTENESARWELQKIIDTDFPKGFVFERDLLCRIRTAYSRSRK
jgi:hypothetical protein